MVALDNEDTMIDTDQLRRRFTAAALCAAAGSVPGCATDTEVKQETKTTSRFVGDDVSAQLCEAWLTGRQDRVCLPRLQAAAKAVANSRLENDCPTSVKTEHPKESVRTERRVKRPPRTMVLITATTEAASRDCRQATCCYVSTVGQPSFRGRPVPGRPLVDASGVPAVASLGPGRTIGVMAGLSLDIVLGDGPYKLEELTFATSHWLEAAQYEHASIGSFARAAGELEALGVPQDLVTDCWSAAADEARHAAICVAIASAASAGQGRDPGDPNEILVREGSAFVDPRTFRFGDMPDCSPRSGTLADFAVRTFVEGGIGESTAALEATRAAGLTVSRDIAEALHEIAADEAAHAALAWRTLSWASSVGGADVKRALAAVAAEYVASLALEVSGENTSVGAPRLGALSAHQRREVAQDAWYGIIAPSLEAMA